MDPVLILCHNNLHLSRKAIVSARAQDIGEVQVLAINNGSTDSTAEWLNTQRDLLVAHYDRVSVAEAWNRGIRFCFNRLGTDYVLVLNNDIELRSNTYRLLVEDGGGFVTGVGVSEWSSLPPTLERSPHPDFACFLIRREVWDTVGPFDEHFKGAYCEDSSYHMRMAMSGIPAYALDLPYIHHGSQVLKNAHLWEVRRIQEQADLNRELFKKMYGFYPGSPEYCRWFEKHDPAVHLLNADRCDTDCTTTPDSQ